MSHIFRSLFGFLTVWLVISSAHAQGVGYGDWQIHLPTNEPQHLADAGDRVYVATNSAFYFFDKKLNTTQLLSRRDGLSDVGVAGVDYDPVTRQVVVVYSSTNIDIIRPDGSVRNLNDIVRKGISGSKTINEVRVAGDRAYVATDFGLVVINLAKLEITDTYSNIGPNGTAVQVYSTAVANDTLFASTSAGLLRGRTLSSVNLLDYRSWVKGPQPGGQTRHVLGTFNGRVFAAEKAYGGVYAYMPHQNAAAGGTWQYIEYTSIIEQLRPSTNGLLIVGEGSDIRQLNYRNNAFEVVALIPKSIAGEKSRDALLASDGRYYVADYDLGFMRIQLGSPPVVENFKANGPQSTEAYSILADARSNTVDVFPGRYSDRYLPGGVPGRFYQYSAGQWTNYSRETLPAVAAFQNLQDFSRGARTPDGTLYIASYGSGLLQWRSSDDFEVFNAANSPLRYFGQSTSGSTYVTDVATDVSGNVWVANRHIQENTSGLFMLNTSTSPPTWTVAPFFEGMQVLDRLAPDDNGYIWASISRKTDGTRASPGIMAIDPSGAGDARYFSSADGLPSNEIYDLVKDHNGDIWAATLLGVAVFNGTSGAFLADAAFRQPLVTRGTGAGFSVLYNEAVKAIAVDGANRKWFGTANGLWLFSPDADEALLHFTTDNSPLPSNSIVDIEVNDKTGEVWVATDKGVVSYRGSATVTEGSPDCTKVSPNPVRPEFTGLVGISGLANNALVKITDVAGHLVYATTATGGTLTWNMNDVNGQRVRSGVYLVLSSDAEGNSTCVSKVAVLSK